MTKNKLITAILTGLFILAQAASLTACSLAAQAVPTATAAAAPFTPAASASPTLTETPAPTDTPTLEPTSTPTLVPSPTPPGFIKFDNGGFSLSYPFDWKIDTQEETGFMATDDVYGIVFIAKSEASTQTTLLAQIVDDFSKSIGSKYSTVINKNGQALLGDSVEAQTADMTISGGGDRISAELAFVHQGSRDYTFAFLCPSGRLDLFQYQNILHTLYGSIRLFGPQPFGLPHNQTITLPGVDPTAQSLDPAVTDASAADYVGLLFSGLVRLTPDLHIVPDLAQKWSVSSDGKVYTFTLLPDLKFSNGATLNAGSVQDSWERTCDPKTGSTTAATYLGDIVGVKDKLAGKASSIQGLKVIDEQTLQVTLDGPKPYFLAKLTYPTSYVMDTRDEVLYPANWMFNPSASGPYMIKEYRAKEDLIFEANPNYPVQPKVTYLAMTFNPAGNPISLYQEGSIDMLGLTGDELTQISKPEDPLHADLRTTPSMCTSMLELNTNLAPLDDVNVRKALAMAIDKNSIVSQLASNSLITTNNILPPSMPGYLAYQQAPEFDAAAAKAALQSSKYAGKMLNLTLTDMGVGSSQSPEANLLASMWKKNLGANIKVQYLDPQNYTSAARKNPGNIIMYSWCADYPDPQNFLDVLFHSGSDFNMTPLNNPQLDSLLDSAGIEQDGSKRLQMYQQAEALLLGDVDVIPVSNSIAGELVKPRIQGYVLPPMHISTLPWLSLAADPGS
ncbi:MAG: peptide ABC transporter substrate-binding protein [Anaerolineaceae bacterium]|nr:peptide ABC transporter substrate-binding protein [Anaerolineaceae bacterium]